MIDALFKYLINYNYFTQISTTPQQIAYDLNKKQPNQIICKSNTITKAER